MSFLVLLADGSMTWVELIAPVMLVAGGIGAASAVFANQRTKALSSLREEMISAQEQRIEQLKEERSQDKAEAQHEREMLRSTINEDRERCAKDIGNLTGQISVMRKEFTDGLVDSIVRAVKQHLDDVSNATTTERTIL